MMLKDWQEEDSTERKYRLLHQPFLGPIIFFRDKIDYTEEEEVRLHATLPFQIGQNITHFDTTYKIVEVDWDLDNHRQYIIAIKKN